MTLARDYSSRKLDQKLCPRIRIQYRRRSFTGSSTLLEKTRRKLLIRNGTDRSRTDDLLRVKQALFQLSYDPLA